MEVKAHAESNLSIRSHRHLLGSYQGDKFYFDSSIRLSFYQSSPFLQTRLPAPNIGGHLTDEFLAGLAVTAFFKPDRPSQSNWWLRRIIDGRAEIPPANPPYSKNNWWYREDRRVSSPTKPNFFHLIKTGEGTNRPEMCCAGPLSRCISSSYPLFKPRSNTNTAGIKERSANQQFNLKSRILKIIEPIRNCNSGYSKTFFEKNNLIVRWYHITIVCNKI